MSLTSLKLLETLLLKPDEHILHNLVLRNLLGRSYLGEIGQDSLTNHQGEPADDLQVANSRTDSGLSSELPSKSEDESEKSEEAAGSKDIEGSDDSNGESQTKEEATATVTDSKDESQTNEEDSTSTVTDSEHIEASSENKDDSDQTQRKLSLDIEEELDSIGKCITVL